MWKPKHQSNYKGFTLVELMVTIVIILILAGATTFVIGKLLASARQSYCEANLKAISLGLQMYHSEHGEFPEDGYSYGAIDPNPLSVTLADYVGGKLPFICKEDKDQASINNSASYDPYYVRRIDSTSEDEELVIGCPRHSKAKKSASLFSSAFVRSADIGAVLVNGQEIPADGTTAQRSIGNDNDVMTFTDGSTVTITDNETGYGVFLVQSIQLADGTLYTIIRVEDEGEIDVQVSDGSRFEVVTPSAIVGVRGTQFTVETYDQGYTVEVALTTGTVVVKNRATGETSTLATGGTTEITIEHSDSAIIGLINQVPPLSSSELKHALLDASPLSVKVLDEVINKPDAMSSSHYKAVLIANSPLPTGILDQVVAGTPPLSSSELNNILDAQ